MNRNMIDADHLRYLRRRRGWTQIELAQAAGINPHTVKRLEVGRYGVRNSTARMVAQALGVGFTDLFTGRNQRRNERAIEALQEVMRSLNDGDHDHDQDIAILAGVVGMLRED